MWSWPRIELLCVVLACTAACTERTATVTTVVLGSVADAATDAPLAGVEVVARSGTETKGRAVTDPSGGFQLQFDAPAAAVPQRLTLDANLGGYRATSRAFEVDKGKPSEPNYALRLLPDAVADCIQKVKPAVVVGHFRAAQGSPDPELSERIADALRYDLLSQIQKANFVAAAQPGIFPCTAAEPKTPQRYGSLARLLGADAFVGGYVARAEPPDARVKVEMSVADGHGVLDMPLNASSPSVDLDDPRLARLAPEANAAVLTALVIGYKLSEKPQECVDLVTASERVLGTLPEALSRLREECQAVLPNRGLL